MKHIVGFSGGIDSQAVARWVLNRYPAADVILMNSDAGGNEHPITTEFVEWYSHNVHPVVKVTPIVADLGDKCMAERDRRKLQDSDPMDFLLMAELKGIWPSRQKQFCTQYLKLEPQRRWIKENVTGKGESFVRYSGVRREEGKKNNSWRATVPIEGWDDMFGQPLMHPFADWTKQMCFDYVRYHGEEVNELYTLGFDRVGCAPCVNANKQDVRNWVRRFPEMIDKVRSWEEKTGRTFFMPIVPGMKINWIDDVVRWSTTAWGGKRIDELAIIQPAACDSKYGLCE